MGATSKADPKAIVNRCREVLVALTWIHHFDARRQWADEVKILAEELSCVEYGTMPTRIEVRRLEHATRKLQKWFPRACFSGCLDNNRRAKRK